MQLALQPSPLVEKCESVYSNFCLFLFFHLFYFPLSFYTNLCRESPSLLGSMHNQWPLRSSLTTRIHEYGVHMPQSSPLSHQQRGQVRIRFQLVYPQCLQVIAAVPFHLIPTQSLVNNTQPYKGTLFTVIIPSSYNDYHCLTTITSTPLLHSPAASPGAEASWHKIRAFPSQYALITPFYICLVKSDPTPSNYVLWIRHCPLFEPIKTIFQASFNSPFQFWGIDNSFHSTL